MNTAGIVMAPDATARVWARPKMGARPVLQLHVYSAEAREFPIIVPGLDVIGATYSDAPCPLVMGPVSRGMAGLRMTRFGSGLKGVREVYLYAEREAYEAAIRRPTFMPRAEDWRWLGRDRWAP